QVVAARGAPEGIDASGAANVHFDRMTANFRKIDKVITIDDALLKGATAGATFNGRIDLGSSTMAINGTYIPAYNFNNTLSRVPLVGLVLGGGPGGGLFGVTFRIEGPLNGPSFFFNPLSVVAPGIFRKIFEFH
ncbi:MAG: AsmA-like C-terminal domain-containing protein, partial [Rhizobiales bacterium]|nr:AsmA-like C-terminal domain-containing protein [Hyphomicrobiales bacterium]